MSPARTVRLSERGRLETHPNALSMALADRRTRGLPTLDLTASNPTQVGLAWPPEALVAALSSPAMARYHAAPLGLPAARAVLARHLEVEAERLMLTASTSEAYALLFKALCDPGDNVLALTPTYPLFEQLAVLEGVHLRTAPWGWDGGWHLDPAAVRSALDPRTRAILLVNPNNPTGHYLREADLETLASFGLPLLVDEVFGPYVHEGPAFSALSRPDLPTVVLDGLSKRCGLPQLKAGWLTVGRPLAALLEALEGIADAYLSISTPVQLGLAELLADAPGMGAAIHARTINNLQCLRAMTQGSPAEVLRVEGGWYASAALPQIMDDEAWALALLDAGVLVQPGYFYDFSRPSVVVVSLLTAPEPFAAGVARMVSRAEGE